MTRIRCPQCGRDDALGTRELIPGVALRRAADAGTLDVLGETEIDWNGQATITNPGGEVLMVCRACGVEWYRALPAPQSE
jgi:hypothetical protein